MLFVHILCSSINLRLLYLVLVEKSLMHDVIEVCQIVCVW